MHCNWPRILTGKYRPLFGWKCVESKALAIERLQTNDRAV